MVSDVLKLNDQFFLEFVINYRYIEWRRFILKKVAIVCALKMKLEI